MTDNIATNNDSIYELIKKADAGQELTETEHDTLIEYYKTKFSSFGNAILNKLKEQAGPLVKERDELKQQIAELQTDSDIQTLNDLRNERKETTKKIKKQSELDVCKTFLADDKRIAEIEKQLRSLNKEHKDAGGKEDLPGIPKSKRGFNRQKTVKISEAVSHTVTSNNHALDVNDEEEANEYSDEPRSSTTKKRERRESHDEVPLRFAGDE